MKATIAGLFALIAIASALSLDELAQQEWQEFKVQHGKSYPDEREEQFRLKVWLENRQMIAKHNSRNDVTFKLGMNKYGDMLHHEFVAVMNGYKNTSRPTTRNNPLFLIPENFEVPKSVDWRKKGFVTPIKDQGQCGSCWAFSATGALEGQHFRKTGKLVSLSEQNLVDCSSDFGNNGCNGGLMDYAFNYIKNNKGIDTEESYPYVGVDGKCQFKREKVGATDTGFVDIPANSEKALASAIATVGPVSVAIDAGHSSFQFYKSGVYYESDCSSSNLDHGVLAVGYDQEKNGDEYFIVKNSWGDSWGDEGYIKMAKNKDNHCGIATQASYPSV